MRDYKALTRNIGFLLDTTFDRIIQIDSRIAVRYHPIELYSFMLNFVFGDNGRRQVGMIRACKNQRNYIDLGSSMANEKIYVKGNFQSALTRSNRIDRWA